MSSLPVLESSNTKRGLHLFNALTGAHETEIDYSQMDDELKVFEQEQRERLGIEEEEITHWRSELSPIASGIASYRTTPATPRSSFRRPTATIAPGSSLSMPSLK